MRSIKNLVFRMNKAEPLVADINFALATTIDGTTNNFATLLDATNFLCSTCTVGQGSGTTYKVTRIPMQVGDTVYNFTTGLVQTTVAGFILSNLLTATTNNGSYCPATKVVAPYIYEFFEGVVQSVQYNGLTCP